MIVSFGISSKRSYPLSGGKSKLFSNRSEGLLHRRQDIATRRIKNLIDDGRRERGGCEPSAGGLGERSDRRTRGLSRRRSRRAVRCDGLRRFPPEHRRSLATVFRVLWRRSVAANRQMRLRNGPGRSPSSIPAAYYKSAISCGLLALAFLQVPIPRDLGRLRRNRGSMAI